MAQQPINTMQYDEFLKMMREEQEKIHEQLEKQRHIKIGKEICEKNEKQIQNNQQTINDLEHHKNSIQQQINNWKEQNDKLYHINASLKAYESQIMKELQPINQ